MDMSLYRSQKYVIYKVYSAYRMFVKLFKHQESLIMKCNKNTTFYACAKKITLMDSLQSYVLQDNGKMITMSKTSWSQSSF